MPNASPELLVSSCVLCADAKRTETPRSIEPTDRSLFALRRVELRQAKQRSFLERYGRPTQAQRMEAGR